MRTIVAQCSFRACLNRLEETRAFRNQELQEFRSCEWTVPELMQDLRARSMQYRAGTLCLLTLTV